MVKRFSTKGVRDWLAQRVTAVLIFIYALIILPRLFCPALNTQLAWQGLFDQAWMKVMTLLAVGSLLWHAWIGLWTVFTDYVKPAGLRRFLEVLVILYLAVLGLWTLLLVIG